MSRSTRYHEIVNSHGPNKSFKYDKQLYNRKLRRVTRLMLYKDPYCEDFDLLPLKKDVHDWWWYEDNCKWYIGDEKYEHTGRYGWAGHYEYMINTRHTETYEEALAKEYKKRLQSYKKQMRK